MRERRGIAAVLLFIAGVFLLVPSGVRGSSPERAVKGIRYHSSREYTRVVMELSTSANYAVNRLRNPERLYVDLKHATLTDSSERVLAVSDGRVRKIRPAQFDDDTVRVVVDLEGASSYKIFRLHDPPRVVMDIFPGSARSSSRVSVPKVWGVKHVVLDAGHGGKDPGAIGPGGIREKTVVLDIARRVKKILEAKGGYRVSLTRNRDRYLSLEERTAYANAKKADLFVSVHANANRSRRLRGVETYFLNFTNNEESLKVAARENKISLKRMKQARSEEAVILASLQLQFQRDESLNLANFIQSSMISQLRKRYSRVTDKGVKQALFYVLVGAKMPSALVEVSYVTNLDEARRLKSATYRQSIARGIADGIATYFDKAAPLPKIAKR
jgi:N-acetylmuramoyl-L-alanine amidase